ncbi:UNVERIFIED_CONTAM: Transposon Tf2-11 polyprotein [Sesamum angustifolium]|uniref:Transposon Tf2-11 polyprotein n=1 Tax=Sesamum angustifolium TaxID=2727405 RepID=A0AAW2J9D2_9LAMI
MAEEDRDKTSFVTANGVYCYNVMPFSLKDAGATYQRLVNKMFKDLIESMMKMYVDYMLMKSRREEEHLKHLENGFAIMLTYGMKLNPMKYMFRVRGGKCLGYMVSEKGIEANPKKIEAIMQLGLTRMVKHVQKLIGKIALLNRFVARSVDKNISFFKILRKVIAKLDVSGRMVKWAVELGEFDIEFQRRTAIKAQVFADFVVEIVSEQQQENQSWFLHVDGSSNVSKGELGYIYKVWEASRSKLR